VSETHSIIRHESRSDVMDIGYRAMLRLTVPWTVYESRDITRLLATTGNAHTPQVYK